MANLLAPRLLPSLVLVEPVVFPEGANYDAGLAQQALRRRATFPSLAAARRHFAGRGIFSRWRPDALEGYLRGGLRRVGDGWELACPPQLEAQFYELGMSHGVWERLGELTVPVRLLIGEESTFNAGSFALDQAAAYRAELTMVPRADHFLPMEQPEAIVAAVLAALGP
jgi:pimeloyl-ACP methyl ester carboxylesterase